MRLIDADALIKTIERADCVGGWNPIIQLIHYAPTIEAVYICNRKKCDRCDPECDFTRDINYAATTDKVIIVDGARTVCLSCQAWNRRADDE